MIGITNCVLSRLKVDYQHFMTDRTANKKLSNTQLIKWIQSEVGEHVKSITALYRMTHVLLGF